MKSEDCELKDECLEFLCEFPDRIPHRCRLCTPMVKYTLERRKELRPKVMDEKDIWNE